MYTKTFDRPRVLRPRHSVENQWDLLAAIGIEPLTREHDPVEMPLDQDAVASIAPRLSEAGVDPHHEIVVVHVSARSPFRRCPIPSFLDTVAALASSPARRVIVT